MKLGRILANIIWGDQHDPSESCRDDHCFTHMRDEPFPDQPWHFGAQLCPECWHFYRTGLHLRISAYWAYVRTARKPWGRWTDVFTGLRAFWRKHYSCAHCSHDF